MFKYFLASCLCILTLCASVGVGHADVLTRLYDFEAGDVIVSQEVDDEFNQIVDLVSGVSTSKYLYCKNSHATDPAFKAEQTNTSGPVAEFWEDGGASKVIISSDTGSQHAHIEMTHTAGAEILLKTTAIGDDYLIQNNGSNLLIQEQASGPTPIMTMAPAGVEVLVPFIADDFQPTGDFTPEGPVAYAPDTQTIIASDGAGTPAAHTLEVTAGVMELVCNDLDGCTITMGESAPISHQMVTIVNTGSNVCNFSDTSGVSELSASYAMGLYDTMTLLYTFGRWVEVSRSNN